MRRQSRVLSIVIPILIFSSVLSGFAQSTTSLRGVVTDQTGAVIPGAIVSLTNGGTGFKRQVLTGEDGAYQFLQAPPGTYQVNFTNPSLALTAPLTFGEFQQTTPPREMQFALRYEF